MRIGRLLSTLLAVAAIAGVAVLVVVMGSSGPKDPSAASTPTPTSDSSTSQIPLQLYVVDSSSAASVSSSAAATVSSSPASSSPAQSLTPTAHPITTSTAPQGSASTTTHAAPPPVHTSSTHPAPPRYTPPPMRGGALPLGYSTGTATHVITVTASSYGSTVATLQAWAKAPGGGWLRWGSAITAHVGSQGLTTSPSESKSATPIGSFGLTQAFGHNSNPGTSLPYRHTTPSDWWISQSGPLYNTEQHCSSGCSFNQGSPNEHLYYETPYYNYAVVIDYNRYPVHQGAGSAFFLHVTDGHATAGCVAIPQSNLITLMKSFLTPGTHPRILIGVT